MAPPFTPVLRWTPGWRRRIRTLPGGWVPDVRVLWEEEEALVGLGIGLLCRGLVVDRWVERHFRSTGGGEVRIVSSADGLPQSQDADAATQLGYVQ